MRLKIVSAALVLVLFGMGRLWAGGFQVNLLGAKQCGMGHVGAGLYLDASMLAINPGGAAFADRSSVIGVANFIKARVNYLELPPGVYTTWNSPTLSTPFALHANFKVNPKLAVGASVYTPFGSRVLYEDDWKGQFLLREISLQVFYIQPTLSYRINDHLSIGAGPIISRGSVYLRRAAPVQFQDGTYGEATLDGSAGGFGFNTGVYWKVNEQWSVGASYRSAVKFQADEGQATFSVPSSLDEFFPNTTFSTSITLPAMTTIGVGFKPVPQLAIGLDFNYVGWSVYDTLGFDFVENTDNLEDLASPREYKNSYYVRIGAQYAVGAADFRAGIYYDKSPVQAGYLTPETPDADKLGMSVGATYRIGKNLEVDGAFLWVEGKKREDVNLESQFGGTYKARAFVPTVGLTWNFNLQKPTDDSAL